MVQCAQRAIQSKGKLRNFYLGLKEKKGHKIAIVATARKLLHIVWAVLVRQEEYRDIRKDLLERKLKKMNKQALVYDTSLYELFSTIEDLDLEESLDEHSQRWLEGISTG